MRYYQRLCFMQFAVTSVRCVSFGTAILDLKQMTT